MKVVQCCLQMSENNSGCLSFVMGQKFLASGKEEDGVGKAVYIPTTHKTTH